MADRKKDEKQRWRKLGVISSLVDAAVRLAEIFLRP